MPRRLKSYSLLAFDSKYKAEKSIHGGALGIGKRKKKRPFVRKAPIHIVIRSAKARGELNLLQPRHSLQVTRILNKQARKHSVKLCHFVNVGNHLHIKIRAYSRETFRAFLKSITAMIARAVTGARKGLAFGKFWDNSLNNGSSHFSNSVNFGFLQALDMSQPSFNVVNNINVPKTPDRDDVFFLGGIPKGVMHC